MSFCSQSRASLSRSSHFVRARAGGSRAVADRSVGQPPRSVRSDLAHRPRCTGRLGLRDPWPSLPRALETGRRRSRRPGRRSRSSGPLWDDWPVANGRPSRPRCSQVTHTCNTRPRAFWVVPGQRHLPHLTPAVSFPGALARRYRGLSAFALGITAPGATPRDRFGTRESLPLSTSCSARLPTFRTLERYSGCSPAWACPPPRPRCRDGAGRAGAGRRRRWRDLDVKIYGRDAWDGQFLVTLWRHVWYRQGSRTLRCRGSSRSSTKRSSPFSPSNEAFDIHSGRPRAGTSIGDAVPGREADAASCSSMP